ncbi:MAG: 3-hydroxyacyl-CoA dehydrogenase NAD-binding domain-containing protein [Gammaproteobacteria bacterium]
MDTSINWHLETDDNNVAWLGLDKVDATANVLSSHVMAELNDRLADLEAGTPKAVIVHSMKKTGFIAGADVTEFTALTGEDQAYELVRAGQKVFDRLEALSMPTIALINGFALGGGLELALACDYRIVVDEDSARLGLPEVQLGIHPGFGGTVRSTRLVGPQAALDMMLTGRGLRPRAAKKIGLVDQVVARRHLRRAALQMALSPPKKRKPGAKGKAMNSGVMRPLIARMSEKQVAKKARKDHYPAPYAIIDLWKEYAWDWSLMYDKEARSIARLMCTPTSRNLVRVFLLQDRLKAQAADKTFKPSHVHVIGAGVMGGDIAAWCAVRGFSVTLQDREPKYIGPAIERAHALFKKKLRRPHLIQGAADRLMPDVAGNGVDDADVVIEAIFENTEAKQALYRSLEPRMKTHAILATNTSSIRLEELATVLDRPERLIGLHFFNPVAKMPLVEVIYGDQTDRNEAAKGVQFARRISRLPLPCRSAPGFVVNRILFPYMIEAMRIGTEGVPLAVIDRAAEQFGMPMGPVELADTVGLDVCLHVANVFAREFGMEIPDRLSQMVERKDLGKKTGRGFYDWKKGKAVKPKASNDAIAEDLTDRLLLPFVNEAAACLREGIVEDADLLDGGVIFGTGFAPFRGGPIQYARDRGIDNLVTRLNDLAGRYGERFAPDAYWSHLQQEQAARQAQDVATPSDDPA